MGSRAEHDPADEPSTMAEAAALLERALLVLRRADLDAVKSSAEFTTRIGTLERSSSEREALLVRTERPAAQLANLYVTAYQLHASLDLREVRTAVAARASHVAQRKLDIYQGLLGLLRKGHERWASPAASRSSTSCSSSS